MIVRFLEDSDELLKVIRRGVAAGDAQQVERAAHGLRGLAANFDAEPVLAIARSMEQAASRHDLQTMSAAFAELEAEVQSLRVVLSGYASAGAPHTDPLKKPYDQSGSSATKVSGWAPAKSARGEEWDRPSPASGSVDA